MRLLATSLLISDEVTQNSVVRQSNSYLFCRWFHVHSFSPALCSEDIAQESNVLESWFAFIRILRKQDKDKSAR